MAEADRVRTEREVRDLELNVNRRFNELQEDLNLRRNEEVGKMQRALLQEVQAYARANGYQLIVSEGVLMFNYIGHGSPIKIADETVISDIDAESFTVTLRLASAEGESLEEVREVERLIAGQATTVVFSMFEVTPGVVYDVTVSLEGGDANPDNDTRSIKFMVNPGD